MRVVFAVRYLGTIVMRLLLWFKGNNVFWLFQLPPNPLAITLAEHFGTRWSIKSVKVDFSRYTARLLHKLCLFTI